MNNFNMNNFVREYLMEFYETNEQNELGESEIIDRFITQYKEYDCYKFTSKMMFKKEFIILVLYTDALKYLLYLHKVGLVNDKVSILLNNLSLINSREELKETVEEDFELFYGIVEYAHKYCEINELSKVTINKSLSVVENSWVTRIFSANIYDALDTTSKITLNDIIEELNGDKEYQLKKYGESFDDSNVKRITGLIRMLGLYDVNNYYELLLEIAKVDYAVSKYLITQIDDCEYAYDRVDFYENYKIEDIIENLSLNQQALTSAIWMVVSLYVDKDYEDIELNDKDVNREVSPQMIKKLSFNNNENDNK